MKQPGSLIIRSILITEGHVTAPEDTNAGWPAYLSQLPEQSAHVPMKAVAIIDTTGITQGKLPSTLEVVERQAVQIQVRSDDYATGWTKLHDIAREIDAVLRLTLTVGTYAYAIPNIVRGGVIPLGQDPDVSKRRYMFTLNIHFSCTETEAST